MNDVRCTNYVIRSDNIRAAYTPVDL
jgi:hypothetical protein